MEKILAFAYTGNTSSMAYNWIYNPEYLKNLAAKHSLLFQPLNPEDYVKSEKSFLAYPDMKVGDLSAEGDILKWLVGALKENSNLTAKDYQNLVFDQVKPGGRYIGYAESYARALVFNKIAKLHKLDVTPLPMDDDQMVGFMPYIAVKALGLSIDKAFELAQAFTHLDVYQDYFKLFDDLLEALREHPMKAAIKKVIDAGTPVPERFQKALVEPTESFITETVNTACHIADAVPLVFHILAHTDSFEEALHMNAWIGGASADRGTLIGALYHTVGTLPKNAPKI